MSVSGAMAPRYQPPPPASPSPFVVAQADGDVAGACQIGARVLDGAGPRAGVELRLSRVTAEGSAELWQAVSDAKGAHRFLDLPRGQYQLTALTDDRAPAASPQFACAGGAARAFFELPLVESDHVFAGKVLSKSGKPAPGAELAIGQETDGRTSLAGTARVPVAADGSFHVRIAPGRYVMQAQAPNHASIIRKIAFDTTSAQSAARFALTPAPRVSGRVLDADGNPIAGALVAAGGVLDPKQRAPSARTEADGSFSLPIAADQDVVVTARADGPHGGLVARVALGIARSALGFGGVDIVAHAGRAVEGVVSRTDGSAWAFGEVRYRVRDLGLTGVEKADASGHFVVAGMPPDADVEVWAEGNATGAWGAQVASPGNDQLALVYTPPAY
jgi:hypothetical protein